MSSWTHLFNPWRNSILASWLHSWRFLPIFMGNVFLFCYFYIFFTSLSLVKDTDSKRVKCMFNLTVQLLPASYTFTIIFLYLSISLFIYNTLYQWWYWSIGQLLYLPVELFLYHYIYQSLHQNPSFSLSNFVFLFLCPHWPWIIGVVILFT